MKITRKMAHELIAPKVKACANNPDRLDDIIFLAQMKAWQSGRWWGITKRAYLEVIEGRIVLPPEYGVLEAINVNGVPRQINSEWYHFNPSGPGSSICDFDYYGDGIFDLMEVPTVWVIFKGEQVVAASRSKNQEDPNAHAIIQGINTDGNYIYRYYCEPGCATDIKKSDLGEMIPLSTYCNGEFSQTSHTSNAFAHDGITNIFKPVTRGPVEIYAVGPRYMRKLVVLEPSQTSSSLRAFRIRDFCTCGPWVEALVKKSEPVKLTQDHEVLQIENPVALIELAVSVYYDFDAVDPDKAAAYFAKGLASLNSQNGEKSGGIMRSLKVTNLAYTRDKRRTPVAN